MREDRCERSEGRKEEMLRWLLALIPVLFLVWLMPLDAHAEEVDPLEEYGFHRIYDTDIDSYLKGYTGWIHVIRWGNDTFNYYENGKKLTDGVFRLPKPVLHITSDNYEAFKEDHKWYYSYSKYYYLDSSEDTELYLLKVNGDNLLRDYGLCQPGHWGWGGGWIAYGGRRVLAPIYAWDSSFYGALMRVDGSAPEWPEVDMMIVQTGWQDYEYTDADGQKHISRHYFYEDGTIPANGLHRIDGEYYYFHHGMAYQSAWGYISVGYNEGYIEMAKDGSDRLYFGMNATDLTEDLLLDENGVNRERWNCYFGEDGTLQTNCWATQAGTKDTTCYLDSKGYPCIGWKTIDGKTYYFREKFSYSEAEGWHSKHYVTMQRGLTYIDPKSDRFMNPDPNYEDPDYKGGGNYYFFSKEGVLQTGWISTKKGKYYADKNGVLASGWKTIDGYKYYFGKDLTMTTGFMVDDPTMPEMYFYQDEKEYFSKRLKASSVYYLDEKGRLKTGTFKVDGVTLYADSKGILKNGWKKSGSNWYYYEHGNRYTGWKQIQGVWYYFDGDGVMAADEYRDGYWIRKNGSWDGRTGKAAWHKDSKGWWYQDGSWYPKSGWLWIDGVKYYFNKAGYLVSTDKSKVKKAAPKTGSLMLRLEFERSDHHEDINYLDSAFYASEVDNSAMASASIEDCGRINSEPAENYYNWSQGECCGHSWSGLVPVYIKFPEFGWTEIGRIETHCIKGWRVVDYQAKKVRVK